MVLARLKLTRFELGRRCLSMATRSGSCGRASMPYTVIRSLDLFKEFLGSIADAGHTDGVIIIPTGLFQSIAADDVAAIVAATALAAPRNEHDRNRVTREGALCGGTEACYTPGD
jgi:hypothetical protein